MLKKSRKMPLFNRPMENARVVQTNGFFTSHSDGLRPARNQNRPTENVMIEMKKFLVIAYPRELTIPDVSSLGYESINRANCFSPFVQTPEREVRRSNTS